MRYRLRKTGGRRVYDVVVEVVVGRIRGGGPYGTWIMSPDGAGLSEGDATKVARSLPGKISGHQGTAGTREGAAESLLRAYQKASVRPQLPEQE